MFTESIPPVVIVGSHRSGTSALTERLAALGLFVGARLDSHAESAFFQRINRTLTFEAGGHWTTPQVVVETIEGITDLESFTSPLQTLLTGPSAAEYWGVGKRLASQTTPWGWKDPRNTYLLPIWKTMFPRLRIVSIQREPRACALSLNHRSNEIRQTLVERTALTGGRGRRRRGLESQLRWMRGQPILTDGWRTLDISGALDVALDYRELQVGLAEQYTDVLTVDYERFVAEPLVVLSEAAAFCNLEPTAEALEEQAGTVVASKNSSRIEAVPLSTKQQRRLTDLGYLSDVD